MNFRQLHKIFLACALALLTFTTAAAQPIDLRDTGADDGIPVLVKHLPDWEAVRGGRAVYAVRLHDLEGIVGDAPALAVVPFGGGTEAVAADYGAAGHLVIVEFSTPQFAADADARINARINELRAAQQNVPTVYQRKGNYSVFVFGGRDEAAARSLVERVHYEKDVRWLGRDPHANEKANRYWINMSASVLVNTIKAAGLAIVMCLGVGGIFGMLVFRRRRAEATLSARYSDAGGMMRLNLDDHTRKLLGQGEK
ncbi:MAG: hypothetical protein QOF61_2361 [Acidobacteriota bacterium]|jgi:hypothetical protein|nr:hypothetical protein [Acidobacteriota bacterium]